MKQQPGLTAEEALEVVWEQWGREFVAQGDLTMDDDCLILLIDADTKVSCPSMVFLHTHRPLPYADQGGLVSPFERNTEQIGFSREAHRFAPSSHIFSRVLSVNTPHVPIDSLTVGANAN
jgi:hypothetical protein